MSTDPVQVSVAAPTDKPPSLAEVSAWLALLSGDRHAIEIRAPKYSHGRTESNVVSRFAPGKAEAAATEALRLSGHAPAVYIVLNGVSPTLRLGRNVGTGATAADIPRRRWLLVDFDPNRPGTVNATAAEKGAAEKVASMVTGVLLSRGWPTPILADSGNGFHLLFQIDLPADDVFGVDPKGEPTRENGPSTLLVKRVLVGLAARFDTPECHVDTGVFDLPRLVKCYGTKVCKGDDTPERPARYSRVLSLPDEFSVVPVELLEAIAAEVPPSPTGAFDLAAEVEHEQGQPGGDEDPWTMTRPGPDVEARAISYLAKCEPAIEGQRGSDKCIKAAVKIGPGFDLPSDTTLRLLAEHYNQRCEPPWSEKELRHKVEDAYKVELRRGWLRDAERPDRRTAQSDNGASANGQHAPSGDAPDDVGAATLPPFDGPPRPLVAKLRAVPAFKPELLPDPLRTWALDIADRKQCSLEFVAVAAVIVLATVVGRKVGIRPKKFDAWTCVPNLWGMIIGRPGMLKSPALEDALHPLRKLAAKARENHAAAMDEHKRALMVSEAKQKAAKDELQKAAKNRQSTTDAELMRLAGEATTEDGIEEPVPRRYMTNDTTIEKLGEILVANPNGVLGYRDEMIGFLRSFEKKGHESDRAFYVESWNGTGSFTFDRIGRGTVYIEVVCLSLLGGIQPGPLASYIRAAKSEAGDDGLVSRFQLSVYPDQVREFKIVDRLPNIDARMRAEAVFTALDSISAEALGALEDEHSGIPYLRFSDDAQHFFYEWFKKLEVEKLRANESPAIESHLSKYRSLMPSLALLFHLVDTVYEGETGPVSLAAARRAGEWCDLLEEHARRIYQSATDGDVQPARVLAERIKESLPNPFVARDVIRKSWKDLTNPDEVELALAVLEDHNWLASAEAPTGPRGGRPTTLYYVNPNPEEV